MSRNGWHREEQPERAIERILDAADKAFVEQGVSAVGMGQIAEAAGCSRGTLYRYFENRHELHVAYVDRATVAVVERVRASLDGLSDPRARLVEAILCAVSEVRANPGTAAWFRGGAQASAARMSRSSELVDGLATRFVAEILGDDPGDTDHRLRARWLVRVILSLLSNPGDDEAEERAIVARFATPALFDR